MDIFKVTGLKKSFQVADEKIEVIRGIDLTIKEGEFVSVIGPSGSGKSTLLYMLGGLDTPTEGTIEFCGKDITKMSDKELSKIRRQEIGFVFQFYNLAPILNVTENVLLPITLDKKDEKKYKERVDELLEKVNLSQRKKHKPIQLSGGQQQRVAFARALINEPKVILADEPTGNLDTKSSAELLALMKKLSKESKTTIIMVTHDLEAAKVADRVINMVD